MRVLEEWVHAVLRGLALGLFLGAVMLSFTQRDGEGGVDEVLVLRYVAYSIAVSLLAIAWRPR